MGNNIIYEKNLVVKWERKRGRLVYCCGKMLGACLPPRTWVKSGPGLLPTMAISRYATARVYADVHDSCCHQDNREV